MKAGLASTQGPSVEKTFDSTMSRELENAVIPKMQMESAKAKSPTTLYKERK